MQPVLVAYAKGAVDDVVEVLCEASSDPGYTLWSLRGNPCSAHLSRPAIAMRICIIDAKRVDPHQIPEDKILGTVHVNRVAHISAKSRVSFHREDLSGEPVVSQSDRLLDAFCHRFNRLLEARGLKLGGNREDSETGPFHLPPLVTNDTGPLKA